MVRSSANNFSEKYIVCSTPLVATNAKLIYQANKCFGARYINLRAYTQGQAVYDGQALGIIEGQYTASDYETLFWPGSDKIHQNNLLSYIWAAKMWNTLLELGYVEGERIETGIIIYHNSKSFNNMIRELIIRIMNHLSAEVHPDAEWF